MKNSPRIPMPERNPRERARTFDEVKKGYTEEEAVGEAKRCLQCKKPLCMKGCPVSIDIPAFIKELSERNFERAHDIIKNTNSLPGVCGRVCPQEEQCESLCILGHKGDPIAVGNLERYVSDRNMGGHEDTKMPSVGRKVAIAGSGPAGLACAGYLAKRGVAVTVFEALHEIGGVLIYGIPEFRLPNAVVQAEIDELKRMGVVFETNFIVGKTASISELLDEDGFDAIFVGAGAGFPRFPDIPGINANGVYSANEYLTRVNLMQAWKEGSKTPVLKGQHVVVMGGGNVAMDAVRTGFRLGAQDATIVYRRTEHEMPARVEEIHHAREEGVDFELLANPLELLLDDEGFVKEVRCIKMRLGEADASGRRRPEPVEGSEFTLPCDVFIVAIGTKANPIVSRSTKGLETNKKGNVTIIDDWGRTTRDKVYAGGDIVTGAATVILAMGAGKDAAKAILHDLGLNED
ncbi:NADPH-dependent glutamate synthase [Chitinivibrio alkaliphilus]|uniref:Glutamate synthase, large subunit n=1 Tax=Chitinivibrio alkaliphilus ACht1 TaxID=1313304 RepID=U7D5W2_9BACT|nr:NADPH-dependent glutamate synthase [Chitinivibrio alkaliphilus]ERP31889.1 glutamate synthase, large subunit [Chitinivibrio alkaliphilus ACht1]